MSKKPTYAELQRRVADLEAQQQQFLQAGREKELILDNANELIAYHDVDNNLIGHICPQPMCSSRN
jgi:hypothetical protein